MHLQLRIFIMLLNHFVIPLLLLHFPDIQLQESTRKTEYSLLGMRDAGLNEVSIDLSSIVISFDQKPSREIQLLIRGSNMSCSFLNLLLGRMSSSCVFMIIFCGYLKYVSHVSSS